MMGASCSVCLNDQVIDIRIPRAENQVVCSTEQDRIIKEANLYMNFAPSDLDQRNKNASISLTSIDSVSSHVEDKIIQQKNDHNEKESPGKNSSAISERNQFVNDPPGCPSTPRNATKSRQEAPRKVQQPVAAGPSKSNLEITRKVGEILDKVISPESSTVECTQVGRQSRLMHADINTVVSVGISGKIKKKKKKKVNVKSITVKPYEEDQDRPQTPESPPKFNVCKHGIPLVNSLDDEEEGGCIKCQRPDSRGGRELQGYLKFKKAERKKSRTFWAKNAQNTERTSRRNSQDFVEKALREFEEFHDKHEPPT